MAIVQIPSNVVVTKQPKVFVYYNATSASGTYYTLTSISNTRGILSKVAMSLSNASSNAFCNFRITVDGIANTFGNPSGDHGALGLPHGANATTENYRASNSFDYFCNITFFNSLTVELMQNSGSAQAFVGNVMYSTE